MNQIVVVGIGADGAAGLSPAGRAHVASAQLLAGGKRQLAYFPDFAGERLVLEGDLHQAVNELRARRRLRTVVLASGDPLFYGIGKLLLEHFTRDELEFVPHVSSVQLAFARLKESWHDARVVSLHGRPLDGLRPALAEGARKIAVLTDARNTPAAIARLVRDLKCTHAIWVCENLGGPDERVHCWSDDELARAPFAPLNLVVLLAPTSVATEANGDRASGGREPPATHALAITTSAHASEPVQASGGREPPGPATHALAMTMPAHAATDAGDVQGAHAPRSPDHVTAIGIADEEFAAEPPGMVTRREVRLIALAYLELHAGEVFWDIGAGSGSVAIEAARLIPSLRVFAIERSAAALEQATANAAKFAAGNLKFIAGEAPAALAGLPDPHAVFIGGSGGKLADILTVAAARLLPAGRLVLNCITLESFMLAWDWLTKHDWQATATQVQLARSGALGRFTAFEPDRPVFVIQARRP